MKTRAQEDLDTAARLVEQVPKEFPEGSPEREKLCKIYGGLCHSFPVLVRTCGLCQALAFSEAKKAPDNSARATAHGLLLEHVGRLLKLDGDVLEKVRTCDAMEYMLYTRRVLAAWIYFKRFAESILKVPSARDGEEGRHAD